MSQPTTQPQPPESTDKPRFSGWTPISSRMNPLPRRRLFITLHSARRPLSFGILESYQKTLLAIVTSIACRAGARPHLAPQVAATWPAPTSPASASAFWCARPASGPTRCARCSPSLRSTCCASRPPPLEPVELRHLRDAVPGVGGGGDAQHPVGQQSAGPWLSSGCWARSSSGALRRFHITRHLCRVVPRFRLSAQPGSPAIPGCRRSRRSPGRCISSSSSS